MNTIVCRSILVAAVKYSLKIIHDLINALGKNCIKPTRDAISLKRLWALKAGDTIPLAASANRAQNAEWRNGLYDVGRTQGKVGKMKKLVKMDVRDWWELMNGMVSWAILYETKAQLTNNIKKAKQTENIGLNYRRIVNEIEKQIGETGYHPGLSGHLRFLLETQ